MASALGPWSETLFFTGQRRVLNAYCIIQFVPLSIGTHTIIVRAKRFIVKYNMYIVIFIIELIKMCKLSVGRRTLESFYFMEFSRRLF